jgi:hypothetical protein
MRVKIDFINPQPKGKPKLMPSISNEKILKEALSIEAFGEASNERFSPHLSTMLTAKDAASDHAALGLNSPFKTL